MDAKNAVEITPTQARRAAEEAYKEEGELITMGDLEKVPAYECPSSIPT
jgi:hypothetical protein